MSDPAVRILFVEDSEDDVRLALRALERERISPVWRCVGSEPLLRDTLASWQPDTILSDFSMPGFGGVNALEIAREMAPEIPFIFVSGTIGEERAIEAIRMGATDYVLKDNLRRLPTALRRALGEAEERRRVRKAEEERLRLVEILEATSDYVGMTDPDGNIIYVNAAWRRLSGVSESDLSGRKLIDFHSEPARRLLRAEALPATLESGLWQGETEVLAQDGSAVPVSQVLIGHRDAEGRLRFRSTIARDIRERKAYEERISYLANYDLASGMPNRSLLADRALQALFHARRGTRTCAVLVVSIDRFDRLSDSYGHDASDALLRHLAARLSAAVREGDTIARLGADAFAVLAADLARPDDVVPIARKVRDCAAAPFALEGREIHLTFSVGASVFPRDGDSFDLLLRNADAAMHRARDGGGNAFQFYTAAMTQEAAERIDLENALRASLAQGGFELHYQPQIDLASGTLIGVEALMRWKRPGHGPVSPALFIPIAEESDLIQPLGAWALAEACRTAARWKAAGHRLRMAVNVSARQFAAEGFVDTVADAMRAHALQAGDLELELTESVLIDDRERAAEVLRRLKSLGVHIAIDDFGTGYSSLSYLSGLPVDLLKIDRAFVMRTTLGGRDSTIAQAIISLGHSLGMRVLAEGVETAEQRDFLRSHRCDEGQGYLFAKPAAAADIEVLLSKKGGSHGR